MAGGSPRTDVGRLLLGLALVVAVLVVAAIVVTVGVRPGEADWGKPSDRVVSPTGDHEVVTYEWSAMIDPGWTLAIERVDGEGREWFWRSAELPQPRSVRSSMRPPSR